MGPTGIARRPKRRVLFCFHLREIEEPNLGLRMGSFFVLATLQLFIRREPGTSISHHPAIHRVP